MSKKDSICKDCETTMQYMVQRATVTLGKDGELVYDTPDKYKYRDYLCPSCGRRLAVRADFARNILQYGWNWRKKIHQEMGTI